jgi:hypothetical protein
VLTLQEKDAQEMGRNLHLLQLNLAQEHRKFIKNDAEMISEAKKEIALAR